MKAMILLINMPNFRLESRTLPYLREAYFTLDFILFSADIKIVPYYSFQMETQGLPIVKNTTK